MNPLANPFTAGESEQTVFRSPRATLESVAQAVCGILNQQGGTALWGIDSLETRGSGTGGANWERPRNRLSGN